MEDQATTKICFFLSRPRAKRNGRMVACITRRGAQASAPRTIDECVEGGDRISDLVPSHQNEDKNVHYTMDVRTCVNKGGRAWAWVIIC